MFHVPMAGKNFFWMWFYFDISNIKNEENPSLNFAWFLQISALNVEIIIYHSVSLGPYPPLANHNPVIFSVPQALKNFVIPPRQTKSPDNSNILHLYWFTNSLQTRLNS